MKSSLVLVTLALAPLIWAENEALFHRLHRELSSGINPHIVGGSEVAPHSHPYAVSLRLKVFSGKSYRCGGALLTTNWIISAAHCANSDVVTGVAYMGAHDLNTTESERQVHYVNEIITHPKWGTPQISDNDLALLFLDVPVKLTAFVQPIRLPSLSEESKSFWRYDVTMLGWGKMGDELGPSPVLLSVESKVVTNFYCKLKYSWNIIQDYHICTDGSNQRGVCTGDSGGPLVITEDDGNFTLLGVTSFGGPKGCQQSYPNVFTRLTSYLKWISETTGIPVRN